MSPVEIGTTTGTQQIEPFGFKLGMTKEQIVAALGADAVQKDDGDTLILSKAPKPHPDFSFYLVCVSPSKGFAKVRAVSHEIESNSFGGAIKEKFQETKTALAGKYGKPAQVADGLLSGSIWNEPEDWMMGLANEERLLSAMWKLGGGVLIGLEAQASSSSEGRICVQYEFESQFATWIQEHNAKKNDSF